MSNRAGLAIVVVVFAFSPALAEGRGIDSQLAADAATADAKTTPPACLLIAGGALDARSACLLEQTYEHDPDAGLPSYVSVSQSPPMLTRKMRLVFRLEGKPTIGVQAQSSYHGGARVEEGTSVWTASVDGGPSSMGAFTLSLNAVRRVRVGAAEFFEVHGAADAQLLPTVDGTAVGVVNLHASF